MDDSSIINNEISRLSRLTKQRLMLTPLDRQEARLHKTTYLLSDELHEIIHNHQWSIHEKGIIISCNFSDIYINGDSSLLYNAWENETNIEICFQDSGIGLSIVLLNCYVAYGVLAQTVILYSFESIHLLFIMMRYDVNMTDC